MTRRAFVIAALVGGLFVGWCYGRAAAVDGPISGSWHPAIVVCPHLAEDSAAHVRLIRYGPEGRPLVYHCTSRGY